MNPFKKLFSKQTKKQERFIASGTTICESQTEKTELQYSATDEESDKTTDYDFETLRDDGIRAMYTGQLIYAEKCFLAALKRRNDDHTKSFLAEVYINKQEGGKALPLLKDLATRHKNDVPLHLAAAHAAELCGEWETVNEAGLAISCLDAEDPNGLFYQAKAQHELKNKLSAIALLTQLLEKHPDDYKALKLRAHTLFSMQQYAEAEKDIDKVLNSGAADEEAYNLKGDIRYALEDADGAINAYVHMRELNPFNRESILLQTAVYIDRQQLDKAINLLDEAICLQPDFAEAYKQRGAVHRMLHNEDCEVDDLKKALGLSHNQSGKIDKEYSSLEERMNAEARLRNPFGF